MNANLESQVDTKIIDEIMSKHRGKPGELLTVMEEVQEANDYKYLDDASMDYISSKTRVPLSQIYSVATFYSFFNLKPQGKHTIIVCRGTACHTKGSKSLLNEVGPILGLGTEEIDIDPSFTTPDNLFTIKTVACFGQCAQSPIVAVDGIMYSNVNSQKPVSYTHLRAHETDSYLVCRLLLEKK